MVSSGICHAFSSDGSTGAGGYKVASYVYVVGASYQIGLSLYMLSNP